MDGKCVFLEVPLDELEKRLSKSNIVRPLLKTNTVYDLYEERKALYDYFTDIKVSNVNVDEAIDKWYESNKDNTSRRVVVLHNNLSLEHFISNKLISWRKSKIGSPVFDLLALFRNYGNKYNFEECLKLYETINPLKKEEINILYIFMIMPPKFEFKGSEYDMCEMLSEKIELIYSATKMILPDQFKDSKKDNQDKD